MKLVNNPYWLGQITHANKSLVGDKIFVLSQLLQENIAVMPGFVLDSSVFKEFIEKLGILKFLYSKLSLSSLLLDNSEYEVLQSVAIEIRRLIVEAKFTETLQNKIDTAAQLRSDYLIIRPSLAVANYQQQGSFGLIKSQVCINSSTAITRAIKQVWADLFNAKSLLYWSGKGVDVRQIGLGILVQPMKEAIASGTIELNYDFPNKLTKKISSQKASILATWGNGHGISRGEVEPDRYVVDVVTGKVINRQIGVKSTAYRLKNASVKGDMTEILESYFVSDSDRARAVLKPDKIKSLIELVKNSIHQKPRLRYFEWILLKDNAEKENKFYLTQSGYLPSALKQYKAIKPTTQNVLTGIAAAPGKATAKIVNYSSISDRYNDLSESILVANSIQPHDIDLLHRVKGIVTEIGGKNSHSAIIARELGIPAIVAVAGAMEILKTGDWVSLDGDLGTVSLLNSSSINVKNPQSDRELSKPNIAQYYKNTAAENAPLATKLMVNLSQPSLIKQAVNLPVDGVGLIRGEFLVSELLAKYRLSQNKIYRGKRSLEEWLHTEYQQQLLDHLTKTISEFAVKFAPKPIYYRSLDFPLSETNSSDSVIGNRGTYAYIKNSFYFQLELAALKKILATQQNNIRLVLPFVRSLKEWQFCRNLVEQAGLTTYPNFQLWIMAEVPSVVFLLPEYIAAGVQGIVIGMNDLTQLILGVDREREEFDRQGLNSNSLAVEKAIAQLIKTAKTYHLPCSICLTQNRQNPDLIEKLIRWGINSISVEIQSVADTYLSIAKAEKRLLLQHYIE